MADIVTKQISALEEVTTPASTDVTIITVDGVARRATLGNLISALAIATTTAKGLMSASDKVALNGIVAEFPTVNDPQVVTLPSAGTITVPAADGPYTVIVLTGTSTVTAINGLVANRLYYISYPTGAGLTVMGVTYAAGDVNQFISV